MARFENGRIYTIRGAGLRDKGSYWAFGLAGNDSVSIYMDRAVTDHFRFLCEAVTALQCDFFKPFEDVETGPFKPKTKVLTKKLPIPCIDGPRRNYYECVGISISHSDRVCFYFDLQQEDPSLEVDEGTCRAIIKIIDKARGHTPIKRPWATRHF